MRKTITIILLLASVVSFVSCSKTIVKTLYDYIDNIIVYKIDDYFDLTQEQKKDLKVKVSKHLKWYKENELNKYIYTLEEIKIRMSQGLEEEDAKWFKDRMEIHMKPFINRILDDTVDFFVSLNEEQIKNLKDKIEESRNEMLKQLELTDEKRLEEEMKFQLKIMKFLHGRFSRSQIDELYELNRQTIDFTPEKIRFLDERINAFLSLIGKGADKDKLKKVISSWILHPEESTPAYYREKKEIEEEQNLKNILYIYKNIINEKQIDHAVKRIDDIIDIIKMLQEE